MAELRFKVEAPIGGLQLRADVTLREPWTVLFGPSGSGKSSILRLIAGLWTPPNATIQLGNEDLTNVPAYRRGIVMVGQQPALFPHMTVEQNIAAFAKDKQAIDGLCEDFNLTSLRRARIQTLSGGERQRVAIARALAAVPRYLLLDEVFTGMHRMQQSDLIAKLREHSRTHSMPILSVTHDVAEALESATETLKIEAGKITAQGPTKQVLASEIDAQLTRLTKGNPQPLNQARSLS